MRKEIVWNRDSRPQPIKKCHMGKVNALYTKMIDRVMLSHHDRHIKHWDEVGRRYVERSTWMQLSTHLRWDLPSARHPQVSEGQGPLYTDFDYIDFLDQFWYSVSWTFRTPIIDFPFDELLKTCWVFSFFRRWQCLWWPEVEDLLYTVHYFGTRGLSTKGWERYSRGEIMEELSDKTFWKSRIILTFPPQLLPSSLLLLIFLGTEIETNFELERMTNSLYKVITTPLLWKCWNWEFFQYCKVGKHCWMTYWVFESYTRMQLSFSHWYAIVFLFMIRKLQPLVCF